MKMKIKNSSITEIGPVLEMIKQSLSPITVVLCQSDYYQILNILGSQWINRVIEGGTGGRGEGETESKH